MPDSGIVSPVYLASAVEWSVDIVDIIDIVDIVCLH